MHLRRRPGRQNWNLQVGLFVAALAMPGFSPAADVEFNRDIRPILSENCFKCHGPDHRKREADLRLDVESSAKADRGSGQFVIKAGHSDQSALIARVASSSPDEKMPPPETGKTLTPQQIELLRKWIDAGAVWEGHWSLSPIKRFKPPQAQPASWVRNAIDAFLLAQFQRHGVAPSPPAEPATLVRRLSFDLLGLPPTSEISRRLNDNHDPEAYAMLVDELLASPHYGERMAIVWLDLVRYADSVGYHGDQAISVSPFRDYVIRAFNTNKPFDRFTIEQLAGDLLPDAGDEQKIASGYNRLGMMSAEGGVQDKEYLAKYAAERVRNLSGTWLGVTLGCCECHDHKFDPFPTRDFYSLEAFFADIEERGFYGGANVSGDWGPRMMVPTPVEASRLAELDGELADLRPILERSTPELEQAQIAWEQTVAPDIDWVVQRPESAISSEGATLTILDDGSILAGGNSPQRDTYTVTFRGPLSRLSALSVEVLPHDSLPAKGPGRAANGNFVLTELIGTIRESADDAPQPIRWQNPSATYEQTASAEGNPYGAWKIAAALDDDAKGPNWGWAILDESARANQAVIEAAAELQVPEGGSLTITLKQDYGSSHTLGHFRILSTSHPLPVTAPGAGLPRAIRDLLAIPRAGRSEAQRSELARYYRSIAPALAGPRQRVADLEADRKKLADSITTTLITVSRAPRTIRVLPRGNWMDDSGEIVMPAVPSVLPQPVAHGERLTRLDLAHWLVSADNPLTARVLANRLWRLFFGAGLSRKLDDVGAQGDWPDHPELLDYLAARLIDSNWDIKAFIRLIVTSNAYQQSSVCTPELRERDPYNRWFARQSQYRLDAEIVRDNALAVSGLLDESIGGRSVRPYQPPGYWAYLNFPTREWENGKGAELYRRGLYTHWQRQYLHPMLLAFDAPCREECAADRTRSNTPLQSLVLLNDPTFVESARVFAERVLREGGSAPADRVAWAIRRALGREPRAAEQSILLALHDKHLAEFQQDRAAAASLLGVGARPVASDSDPVELAAWTSVTRVILNLHETITRN